MEGSGRRLPELRGRGCWRAAGFHSCAGYARLRLESAAQLFEARWLNWNIGSQHHGAARVHVDQLHAEVGGRFGPLDGDLLLAVDPVAGRATYATYGLGVTLGCGCYRVGVQGQSRLGQPWSDLWLSLSMPLGGAIRCRFNYL
jgi:hypothetical protein